jgi:hypothetical protein
MGRGPAECPATWRSEYTLSNRDCIFSAQTNNSYAAFTERSGNRGDGVIVSMHGALIFREYLPRVEDVFRIEELLDPPHQLEFPRSYLHPDIGCFRDADTVFP